MTEDRDEWRKYFMVWPTLGSRTADEQNSRACIRLSAYAMSQKRTCVCVFRFYRATLCWRGIRCRRVSVRPSVTSCLSITSRYCIETTGRIELVLSIHWDRWKKSLHVMEASFVIVYCHSKKLLMCLSSKMQMPSLSYVVRAYLSAYLLLIR